MPLGGDGGERELWGRQLIIKSVASVPTSPALGEPQMGPSLGAQLLYPAAPQLRPQASKGRRCYGLSSLTLEEPVLW